MKPHSINKPDLKLLAKAAPLHVWQAAEKAAMRSTVRLFHTGAAIWYPKQANIISTGCSHPVDSGQHCHAEEHAVQRVALKNHNDQLYCLIVTLTQAGNWASNSRPCTRCVCHLASRGIGYVIYPYFDKQTNQWAVQKERVGDLYNVAFADGLINKASRNTYARSMRVPAAR